MSEEAKIGDNGGIESHDENIKQPETEKTSEQLKEERLARYIEHPESFVELSQVIMMAIRNPRSQLGISTFVGHCKRSEMNMAEVELVHICLQQRLQMDIQSEMVQQAQKNLITPAAAPRDNGLRNFLRKKR